MGKAIRVFKNKEYIYTTNKFNTCKEAVKDCKNKSALQPQRAIVEKMLCFRHTITT